MRRGGFALLATLVAITIIGALVSGALFATLARERAAAAELRSVRALAFAEYGLAVTVSAGGWDSSWSAAPPGLAGTRALVDGDAVDTVRIALLGERLCLVASEARVGAGREAARRRVAALVVLDPAGAPSLAPVRAWTDVP